MKKAIWLGLLSCAGLQAALEHRITALVGAQSAYKGHSTWLKLEHAWYNTYTITNIDIATNRLTAPGMGAAGLNERNVRIFSDGGSIPTVFGALRDYVVCNIVGDTFELTHDTCSYPAIDITNAGSGTLKIGRVNQTVITNNVFAKTLTVPAGVAVARVSCESHDCALQGPGRYLSIQGAYPFWLKLDTAASAAAGTGSVSVTVETAGYADRVVSVPYTVKNVTVIPSRRPTSIPAVPGKAIWETQMLARAAQWCPDKANGTLAAAQIQYGLPGGVWFYDGAWVYSQIADYTGDGLWRNCAATIASWYRDYTLNINGGHQGFKAFTDGLKRHCYTCDGRYKVAALRTAQNIAYRITAGEVRDDYMRETAYVLEAQLNAARSYGYGHIDRLPSTAPWDGIEERIHRGGDQLLGQIEVIRGTNFIYQQTFMIGLAMRALIDYYEFTEDPRVPAEIKATLDYLWSQCWNRTDIFPNYANKTLWHNAAAVPGSLSGPQCDFNCRNTNEANSAVSGLINLVVPAFAWFWWHSGDDTYRIEGDAMFQHALDSPIDFSGKEFSQNYRWSFDYVNLREGRGRRAP